MLKVNFIANASPASGVGYYAANLAQALQERFASELKLDRYDLNGSERTISLNNKLVTTLPRWPGILNAKPVSWWRLGRKLYPSIASDTNSIVHVTNQTLSFMARGLRRSIVTVHDIIELTDPQTTQAKALYAYLYSGIPKASHIIAVSQYTADIVAKHYALPADRITVIPNGVSEAFFPIPDFATTIAAVTLRKDLKIENAQPIILFVGSDHPRKNLNGCLRAFAQLLSEYPQAVFLKMGEPGLVEGRATTLRIIDELGIKNHVRIIAGVSTERLNELYNIADVLVLPSLAEGFGLPVLEAMAAGTPVVTSNVSSLPEVAGDTALLVDPNSIEEIAQGMQRIIGDQALAADIRQRGLERAKLFTWESVAQKTMAVYRDMD